MEQLGIDAVKTLGDLDDQIKAVVCAPTFGYLDVKTELSTKEQDIIRSSILLIRQLLLDAQQKFCKMVEDNKLLATKIDDSIKAANMEVNSLRNELEFANKQMNMLSQTCGPKITVDDNVKVSSPRPVNYNTEDNDMKLLLEENSRLEQQVRSLQREIQELRAVKAAKLDQPGVNEYKLELIQTNQELSRAKEAIQAIKADRKRLKAEKLELLHQMKQLYGTLEEKESELRDFIRNYEHRMKESDESIKQLVVEKEECEHEKWEILRRAQEAAERAVVLRTQLDQKEEHINKLEQDLQHAREQLAVLGQQLEHSHECPSSNSQTEQPPPYHENCQSKSDESMGTVTPKDSIENLLPISLINTLNEDFNSFGARKRSKKKPFSGSFSKVFSKSKNRRSLDIEHPSLMGGNDHSLISGSLRLSTLNQDNYQEKLKLLAQTKGVCMENWKASQVLAWLEISTSMPMYGAMCAENVKSGKVLLGLSDSEMESALGISNPMHRRKLRLAIEELRDPSSCKYPKAGSVDHTWISHRWIHDLGLPQFSSILEAQLVDGRLLNVLSKKDMEKHFNINRKFHQISIFHAVELLRRINFDKEMLVRRRSQCETLDCDPIVWTNNRMCRWISQIDLEEYADNLKDTGVHGALMVLEPSFSAETLATALGIPPSKSYIRRHLTTEFEALVQPARMALDSIFSGKKRTGGGSLGRSFHKSRKTDKLEGDSIRRKLVFKGSLGRAFGRKAKDLNTSLESTPETPEPDRREITRRKANSSDHLHPTVV